MLPFHILNEMKHKTGHSDQDTDKWVSDNIPGIRYFLISQKYMKKSCFASPISPQGLLIFPLLMTSYRWYLKSEGIMFFY